MIHPVSPFGPATPEFPSLGGVAAEPPGWSKASLRAAVSADEFACMPQLRITSHFDHPSSVPAVVACPIRPFRLTQPPHNSAPHLENPSNCEVTDAQFPS